MINEAWDSFSKLIPQGAPEVQRIETRRAFYAGAWAVFNMLMRLDGGAEPTPADMRKLDLLKDQLDAYVEELKAEEAAAVTPLGAPS